MALGFEPARRVHRDPAAERRFALLRQPAAVAELSPDAIGAFEDHAAIDQICDIELAIMLETYREDYVSKKTAEAESLAVMGRLTAGLAHEVRNPLNAAKLQLDVLRRNAARVTLHRK